MAFAARKDEDGTWRLCKRGGDTIRFVKQEIYPDVQIIFSSQAKTKACADELNELFWKEYERHERKSPQDPNPRFWEILDVIKKHGGLSEGDLYKVKNG